VPHPYLDSPHDKLYYPDNLIQRGISSVSEGSGKRVKRRSIKMFYPEYPAIVGAVPLALALYTTGEVQTSNKVGEIGVT
jgi:hypothetical protein